jgi:hypothetical protein
MNEAKTIDAYLLPDTGSPLRYSQDLLSSPQQPNKGLHSTVR